MKRDEAPARRIAQNESPKAFARPLQISLSVSEVSRFITQGVHAIVG